MIVVSFKAKIRFSAAALTALDRRQRPELKSDVENDIKLLF